MATEGSDQTTPRAGDGAAPARSDGAVLRLWLARQYVQPLPQPLPLRRAS